MIYFILQMKINNNQIKIETISYKNGNNIKGFILGSK